jgi:hypothetical protein
MSCHLAPWVWLVQTFALWCWPQTSSVWSAWVNELGGFFFENMLGMYFIKQKK